MELPLNLPVEIYRKAGMPATLDAGTTARRFENKILMNRVTDVNFGDQQYSKRLRQALTDKFNRMDHGGTGNLTNALVAYLAENIPDVAQESEKNYMVKEPWGLIQQPILWFSKGNEEDNEEENEFLSLPYFPFISNCKGGDSQLPISKIFEDNPGCFLTPFVSTQAVDPYLLINYLWQQIDEPTADRCNMILECSYEEQIDIVTTVPRWYEQPGGTELWYMSNDPQKPEAYEPLYTVQDDGEIAQEYGWGRSVAIKEQLGTFRALPVIVRSTSTNTGGLPMQIPATNSFLFLLPSGWSDEENDQNRNIFRRFLSHYYFCQRNAYTV